MCNPITTYRPDTLLDKGTHYGYEWEVTSNPLACRCGYVRIPPGHPWHGKDYDDVRTADGDWPEVHGGLTFAHPDTHCGQGGPDDAWWLGFDAAHPGLGDRPDPALPGYNRVTDDLALYGGDGTIKTTGYVAAECWKLIEQARDAQEQAHPV